MIVVEVGVRGVRRGAEAAPFVIVALELEEEAAGANATLRFDAEAAALEVETPVAGDRTVFG